MFARKPVLQAGQIKISNTFLFLFRKILISKCEITYAWKLKISEIKIKLMHKHIGK